jgi:hypothetical protein
VSVPGIRPNQLDNRWHHWWPRRYLAGTAEEVEELYRNGPVFELAPSIHTGRALHIENALDDFMMTKLNKPSRSAAIEAFKNDISFAQQKAYLEEFYAGYRLQLPVFTGSGVY